MPRGYPVLLDGNEVLSELNAAAGMFHHGQMFDPAEREAIVFCGTATRHGSKVITLKSLFL